MLVEVGLQAAGNSGWPDRRPGATIMPPGRRCWRPQYGSPGLAGQRMGKCPWVPRPPVGSWQRQVFAGMNDIEKDTRCPRPQRGTRLQRDPRPLLQRCSAFFDIFGLPGSLKRRPASQSYWWAGGC